MSEKATRRLEPDASNDDQTLKSWDDLEHGARVEYVGPEQSTLGLRFRGPLAFQHVSMTGAFVTFHDRFNGRRVLDTDDYPASDFASVTEAHA